MQEKIQLFLVQLKSEATLRTFWIDSKNKKTYFQINTCEEAEKKSCPFCTEFQEMFKPVNKYSIVNSRSWMFGDHMYAFAEIEGFPTDLTTETLASFLKQEIELIYESPLDIGEELEKLVV